MKKNIQVKFKGDKEGYCNICGQYSQLTRDHIPPQGCVKPTPVELRTLTQYFSEPSEKPTTSQSGLNILSICGNCNNNLLGTEYDPELIEVSKQVDRMVRVQQELSLSLPEKIDLSVKPQRLIRSVVGHILAGKLPIAGKPPMSAPFPDALRNYFLNFFQVFNRQPRHRTPPARIRHTTSLSTQFNESDVVHPTRPR